MSVCAYVCNTVRGEEREEGGGRGGAGGRGRGGGGRGGGKYFYFCLSPTCIFLGKGFLFPGASDRENKQR